VAPDATGRPIQILRHVGHALMCLPNADFMTVALFVGFLTDNILGIVSKQQVLILMVKML
jgi:hypothetical protein